MNDKIVVTGAGMVSSIGNGVSETWDAILSGKCGIQDIDDFNSENFECRKAARVKSMDLSALNIHPRDSRIMDIHSFMLVKASRDALADADLNSNAVSREEIGYFAGMGMVDYNIEDLLPATLKSLNPENELDLDRFFSNAYQETHPLWPLSMLNNISFCQVAIDLGIKGENTVFSPNADSGAQAIIEAYNSIAENKSTAALAGGVSEKVSPLSITRSLISGILNTEGTSCMPFSKDRKGTLLGEGCGIIAMERQSSAERRGIPALASVAGYGSTFEKDVEASCPATGAISRSMSDALKHAKLDPADIDLIIAHGDGSHRGDQNETDAIHRVFAGSINKLNVYSSKGALGHMLSGAPASDIILGIRMIKNGIIPSINNALPQEDGIKFNLVSSGPVKAELKHIMINSFGSEGQSISLIIEATE